MSRGTEVHEIVQGLMHDKYPGFLSEVKVAGYGIKGSCDGLLPVGEGFADTGQINAALIQPTYELQEYKSISTKGAMFLKPKPYGKVTDLNFLSPKPEHVKQARIYYMLLQTMGYLMDGIRIIYIDRDDLRVHLEIEVDPWGDIMSGTFLTEVDILNTHVEENTMPEQMPDDYWLCRYCNWRTLCKPELGETA